MTNTEFERYKRFRTFSGGEANGYVIFYDRVTKSLITKTFNIWEVLEDFIIFKYVSSNLKAEIEVTAVNKKYITFLNIYSMRFWKDKEGKRDKRIDYLFK